MSALFYLVKQLKSQWLTSLLLALCVALGTAFIGVLLALTQNERDAMQERIASIKSRELQLVESKNDFSRFKFGDNPVWIFRLPPETKKVVFDQQVMKEIQKEAPSVVNAYVKKFSGIIDPESRKSEQVYFISKGYLEVLNYKIIDGAMPSQKDFDENRKVIALTEYAAQKHFKYKKDEDQKIIGRKLMGYKVVGIFRPIEGKNGSFREFVNKDFDFGVNGLIPAKKKKRFDDEARKLYFVAAPGENKKARAQLTVAAEKRWGAQVSVSDPSSNFKEYDKSLKRRSLAMAVLGVGGVLVASLCAFYLLLARVTIRQRQFAVAKTIGATQWSLAGQIVGEVFLLGVFGGGIGILMSFIIIQWINGNIESKHFVEKIGFDLPTMLLVIVGMVITLLVFAIIPALKAARVRPAEVLRA